MIAGVELAAAVGAFAGLMPLADALLLFVLALATAGLSGTAGAYPYMRLLAGFSAGAASAIAAHSMLGGASPDYAMATAVTALVVAVVVVPMQPLQCLAMGGIVWAASLHCGHPLFFGMLTAAATAIGAAVYAQRRAQFQSYVEALHVSAELREYQSAALRAESSMTMVRLTAALAHELSSPVGALASGIETLLAVGRRFGDATPEARQRMAGAQTELGRSLGESLERLRKIVNRIQRLTNLDEAALQKANLNELVNEAVGLMRPRIPESAQFRLDLRPVPDVTCRPQRLIAVVCSLLTNSIQALNGDGRITISTERRDSMLELKIEDNGRGIPPAQLAQIFDPRFEISNGRVSTGNWSLFMSRQYVKEQGGDIRIQSLEGKGTTVCLTLPASS